VAVDDDLFPLLRPDAPGRTASGASLAFSTDAHDDTDARDDDDDTRADDDDDADGAPLRPATAPAGSGGGGGTGARLSLSSPRSQPIAVQRPPPRASDPGPLSSVGAFSWRARAAPDAAADALSGGAFMPPRWREERRCVSDDEEDKASPNDDLESVRRQHVRAHTRAARAPRAPADKLFRAFLLAFAFFLAPPAV
jgi:hypothetical protein